MKALLVSTKIDIELGMINIGLTPIERTNKDDLKWFYKHLDCKYIDCVYAKGYDVWVDDEGLLTSGQAVNKWSIDGHELDTPLAGNLIITKLADNLGRTVYFENDEDFPEVRLIEVVGVTK